MPQLSFPEISIPEKPKDATEILRSWNLPGVQGFLNWVADTEPHILTRSNKYEKFVPTPDQLRTLREVLKTEGSGRLAFSLVLLIWPRRHSKSTLFALICLWILTSKAFQTIQLLGNHKDHSRRTQFNLLRKIITNTPKLAKMLPEDQCFGQLEIRYPALQSVIQMATGTSTAGAFGDKLNVLWVSDLHECPDLDPFNAYQAALIDSIDSILLIDSNVDETGGHVHELEKHAKVDDTVYCNRIKYRDFKDYERKSPPWIDKQRAKRLKATSLPAAYKRDILGQRSARTNALFDEETIKKCMSRYAHPVADPAVLAQGRAFKIGAGLDRAKSLIAGVGARPADSTVWTVIMKVATPEGEPSVYVLSETVFKLNVAHIIKQQILRDTEKYKIDNVCLENTEVADLAAWAVTNKIPVELVSASDSYQNVIFPHLRHLAVEGRLHFPAKLKRLASEMATFTYTSRPGGKYSFGHVTQKHHDDCVYALAAAVWSLRTAVLSMYQLGNIQCVSKSAKRRLCYLMGGDLVLLCSNQCNPHYQVEQMLKEYKQFTGDDDILIDDFFKTRVQVKGARLYQAA